MPRGKNNHLEEAVRALISSQAKLVELHAKADERQAKADERQARADERQAKADERQAIMEKEWIAMRREMDQIISILNSHTKILEALPETIQKKIGFKSRE